MVISYSDMPKTKVIKKQISPDEVQVTVIDYVPTEEEISKEITTPLKQGLIARDMCGDGTEEYLHNDPLVIWKGSYPVKYFIQSSVPASLVSAVDNSFNAFNEEAGFKLYEKTTNSTEAKVNVSISSIDESGGTLARATWNYSTSTMSLIRATITFDSNENWAVLTQESCGSTGSIYDLCNVGTHEVGHISGLSHAPSDKLQTMYASTSPGKTLGRTLGLGDKKGFKKAYNITEPEPQPEPTPTPEPIPQITSTAPKVTTINGTTHLNLAYENINGQYVPITTLTGTHSLPFGGLHAKIITISGKRYVYLYYYRAANVFNTLGRIPLQ